MGTHPIFESDFDCLTDMSDSDSESVEEFLTLADRLRVKYVNEIEDKIKKIKNIEDVTDEPPSKKARKIASWLDAKLNPKQEIASFGPGCSICISTFQEI